MCSVTRHEQTDGDRERHIGHAVAGGNLERLRASRSDWVTRSDLFGETGPSESQKKALKALLKDQYVVELGQLNRKQCYALCEGTTEKAKLLALANAALSADAAPIKATATLPITSSVASSFKRWPTKVREHVKDALKPLFKEGAGFRVRVGRSNYYVLRRDVETLLNVATPARDPSASASKSPTGERIHAAYLALKRETSLRNVNIHALLERSGVQVADLHTWLEAECHAHRANPTRGEPTAATPAEKESALRMGGESYLYIELDLPQGAVAS